MPVHVFWDNSNVWGGAQDTSKIKEPNVPWFALRVYFKNIHMLATQNRDAPTKVMAGSVPPECEELWGYARSIGYDTDLLYRIKDSGGRKTEQAVDEMLHLKMANTVLDFSPPQTMIVLSGDGDKSKFNTSFPTQINRALSRGWDVEIYSWSSCYNAHKYRRLSSAYPGKLKIVKFDPYYYQLTFVKGGEYYQVDDAGTRFYFSVSDRIVQQLIV